MKGCSDKEYLGYHNVYDSVMLAHLTILDHYLYTISQAPVGPDYRLYNMNII